MGTEVEVRLTDSEPTGAAMPVPAERAHIELAKPQLSDLALFLKRTRAVVPVAVVGVFLILITAGLYFAKIFVMPIIVAALLTFLLKPVVRWLGRWHVPQVLGAVIVMTVFFGLLGFGVTRVVEPAVEWTARAPETIRTLEEKFQHLLRRAQRISAAAARVEDITKDTSADAMTPQVEVKQPVLMRAVFFYTTTFVMGLIETVVLLFFMLGAGDLFMEKLVRVLPTLHDKKVAV